MGGTLGIWACSTAALDADPKAPAPEAPDASESRTPEAPEAEPKPVTWLPVDGGGPLDAEQPLAELPCLGDRFAVTLSGGLPYVGVRVGTPPQTGSFLLDVGTTQSTLDRAAFGPHPPAAAGCDTSQMGQVCTYDAFDLFGPWGSVFLVNSDHAGIHGTVRQAGIIGTDFLSTFVLVIDYRSPSPHVHRALEAKFCDSPTLERWGLRPLPTDGFYASDLATLHPLTDVMAGAPANFTVANVPTVPVSIGGVGGLAQLDTGFDDVVVPFSVNVNRAFFDALRAGAPGALVRAPSKDLTLTTCTGAPEVVRAYDLAPAFTFDLQSVGGRVARSFPNAVVFVKETPDAAVVCGGIGTWTVPAAQIGASFFRAAGVVAFDPFTSRVWIRAR